MTQQLRRNIINNLMDILSDIWVMSQRNMLRYIRLPQLMLFNVLLNVVLLLLFNYVFGGTIVTGCIEYIQYFVPGFMVQTVVFGSTQTSIGIAQDLSKGLIDRFRSLPMSRLALFAGRVISDAVRYVILIAIMIAVGSLMGFRFENNIAPIIGGIALIVLFGITLTWIGVFIGISVRDVEAAEVAGFAWVFPFVFASSIFVPIETMPSWLQVFAEINPVTPMVDTMRTLSSGGGISESLWKILVWDGAILLLFMSLSLYKYKRLT